MRSIKLSLSISFLIISLLKVYSQNQHIADSCLNTVKDIDVDTVRIRDIIHFANDTYRSNLDLALIFTKEALDQSIKANYQLGIGDAYNLYGIIYSHKGEYDLSSENYLKALEIYQRINDKMGMVNIYNNLGLVYSDLGSLVNALDSYIRGLKVMETYDDDRLLSLLYSNMAKLYLEVQDHEKAYTYLKQAEEFSLKTEENISRVYIYNMLGSVAEKNNNLDEALDYYTKSLPLCEKANNKIMFGSTYLDIGGIYFEKKEFDQALEYYLKALDIARELNNSTSIIRTLVTLGYYYYYVGESDLGLECSLEALNLSEVIGFQEGIKNASLHLSYIYKDLGNFQRAYEYRIYHDNVYDQMYSNETFQSVTELFAKLEQERREYEHQLDLQKNKISNLVSLLLAISFLALFAGLFFIQRRIAQRAIRRQEYLNKELTSKAIFLVRKNEVFSKIESILSENKHRFIKENQGTIQEIMNEIKLAQNEEVWKEFEIYFNKVHRNFHNNLNEKYPNLTVNERRLCSLLRMNMTTKDISQITQQTAHTIDIARSRLRKKLGIANQKTSLYTFLAQY